jgi:protein TonB
MEIKKTPKADLENKKSTWLLVGYVIVLAFMFIAFEWTKRDIKIDTSQAITDLVFEEEIIPITEQPEQAAPPPPPAAPPIAETLTIVEDDADVEETTIATSEETNQAVEIKYVPVAVEEEEPEEQTIFEVVEQMPEFPNGGMAGLMQYLSKNIKYPTIAQENGTQGRVTVQFVVNRDGSIVDAKVLRGVDPYLDKEAIRVISSMPKWKPGMQHGKAVRVKYTVPVMFRLQ